MHLPILLQRITRLLNEQTIKAFIDSRQKASENTKLAYFYDLRAFVTFLAGKDLTQTQLNLYQLELQALATSSQHRKITNINTFLKYLYQNGKLPRFYELYLVPYQHQDEQNADQKRPQLLDVSQYYQQVQKPGDLIALLILEFGSWAGRRPCPRSGRGPETQGGLPASRDPSCFSLPLSFVFCLTKDQDRTSARHCFTRAVPDAGLFSTRNNPVRKEY